MRLARLRLGFSRKIDTLGCRVFVSTSDMKFRNIWLQTRRSMFGMTIDNTVCSATQHYVFICYGVFCVLY